MEAPLINRVANSGIITINLEQYYPTEVMAHFDLREYLFMEMVLKEKDFRAALKAHDWSQYQDQILLIYCSNDAIIPMWAYMLVASYAEGVATDTFVGSEDQYINYHYQQTINRLDVSSYVDKRIVIKGCSDKPVPAGAYQALTRKLKSSALSIMFGEPCSKVPIYKKPK